MIRGRHHALGKGGNSLIGSLRGWRRVEAQHVASTMKIVDDAVDLEQIEPVAHTAFRVRLGATVFDLRELPLPPTSVPGGILPTLARPRAFARVARETCIGGNIGPSVRDPEAARCVAALDPAAFAAPRPDPAKQAGWLVVQQDGVVWRGDSERLMLAASTWLA